MANQEQLAILYQGVDNWNQWRQTNPQFVIHLNQADLRGMDLRHANLDLASLYEANLSGANLLGSWLLGANLINVDLTGATLFRASLDRTDLMGANLSGANLNQASLTEADLTGANLSGAHLIRANLQGVSLRQANLFGADLTGAHLEGATLIDTNCEQANFSECSVYGISAWNLRLDGAIQSNLVIRDSNELTITVDDLEVAQFIHLLLRNERIRYVIDSITGKVVLLLGRFTPKYKAVLDALREELRARGWVPILFDFEKPNSRNITETVSTLAHMARFIIADITDAKSIPQELYAIVPHLPSVPVQPLLAATATEYGMFESIRAYPWVLPLYRYTDQTALLETLQQSIIGPAEEKARQLQG